MCKEDVQQINAMMQNKEYVDRWIMMGKRYDANIFITILDEIELVAQNIILLTQQNSDDWMMILKEIVLAIQNKDIVLLLDLLIYQLSPMIDQR